MTMKKSIFLCLVLGTLTMNAQVTLIGTVNGSPASTCLSPAYADWGIPVQYYYSTSFDSQRKELLIIFNDAETLQQYAAVEVSNMEYDGAWVVAATKNFWTTDGKMAFLLVKAPKPNEPQSPESIPQDPESIYNAPRKVTLGDPREMNYYIIDETGTILQTLATGDDYGIIKTESGYMLLIGNYEESYSVYSIPGNGLVTE